MFDNLQNMTGLVIFQFELDCEFYPREIHSISSSVIPTESRTNISVGPELNSHLMDKVRELSGEPMLVQLCQDAIEFCRKWARESVETDKIEMDTVGLTLAGI